MPEPNDPKIVEPVVEPVDPQGGGEPKEPKEPTKVPLSDLISERKKRQDLEKQLQEIADKQKADEEEKLKATNEFKTLYENEKSEKERLKAELEPDALAFRTYKEKQLEEIKVLLGDDWDENMKTVPIDTLKKLVAKKVPAEIIDTDGSGTKINVKKLIEQLTEAEKKDATLRNLSLEDYVELKARQKKGK